MDETPEWAAELREEFLARCGNSRKRNSIDRLWRALEHLRAVRSHDFSLANVGRSVAALGVGGPATQTLRNQGGQDFRELIAAYAAKLGGAKRPAKDEDDLVAMIQDLRTRASVRLLMADLATMKRRNDLLHAQFRKLDPRAGALADMISLPSTAVDAAAPILVARPGLTFSDSEKRAVRRFLNSMERDHGWAVDEASGAVLFASNRMEVAGPGFCQALRKILDSDSGRQ